MKHFKVAKWSEKYPMSMKRWERDWDVITPIFKFSADVRTVIYTTNAIESLNATYRKLNSTMSKNIRVASRLKTHLPISSMIRQEGLTNPLIADPSRPYLIASINF